MQGMGEPSNPGSIVIGAPSCLSDPAPVGCLPSAAGRPDGEQARRTAPAARGSRGVARALLRPAGAREGGRCRPGRAHRRAGPGHQARALRAGDPPHPRPQGRPERDHGYCSCPVGRGCKHVAAAVIAWEKTGTGPLETTPSSSPDPLPPSPQHWLTRVRQADAADATASDADDGAYPATVRDRLLYVLDLDRVSGHLIAVPMKGTLRKDGTLGRTVRRYDATRLCWETAPKFVRPVDLRILHRIEVSGLHASHLPHGRAPPEPGEVLALLGTIAQTGRGRWAEAQGPAAARRRRVVRRRGRRPAAVPGRWRGGRAPSDRAARLRRPRHGRDRAARPQPAAQGHGGGAGRPRRAARGRGRGGRGARGAAPRPAPRAQAHPLGDARRRRAGPGAAALRARAAPSLRALGHGRERHPAGAAARLRLRRASRRGLSLRRSQVPGGRHRSHREPRPGR